MSKVSAASPVSFEANVARLPHKGMPVVIEADAAQRAALAAEKLDHHPDWSNVYKTVEVKLNTHDAGGLTELDFELARRMSRYAGSA